MTVTAAPPPAPRAPTRALLTPNQMQWVGVGLALLAVLVTVPPITLETPVAPAILGLLAILCFAWLLRRGARKQASYVAVAVLFCLVLAYTIQTAEKVTIEGIVTAGLFAATLRFATPLVFASLGGLYSERSGVVNVGLEGMMLTGAFFGVLVSDKTSSWVIGLLGAAVAAGVLALIHAFFSIHLRADQIVSGFGINILALGGTSYLFRSIYGTEGTPEIDRIPAIRIPLVRDIPFVGDVIGNMNIMIWLALILVALTWFFVFRTPWGLRMRAVGEHPRAADTVGIDVYRVRYLAVVTSGALAGLGGAYLSFGLLGLFNENMTAGRGFIALAALIFGKWHPVGALGACLLFGFSQALGNSLQTSAGVSANVVSILPYALTLIALVGLVGRSVAPASVGRPYQKQ
jgi:simple sugar transport system permease protein